ITKHIYLFHPTQCIIRGFATTQMLPIALESRPTSRRPGQVLADGKQSAPARVDFPYGQPLHGWPAGGELRDRRYAGQGTGRGVEQGRSRESLGQRSLQVRTRLGESLASVQKFNVPIEATTSSLEALRIFSMGVTIQR